jgi:Bifunctional DNA primase/polymerase, N-terminal/Primase C terminal 2 (PriCT-2)
MNSKRPFLDHALALAHAGFAVFPCKPRGKEPMVAGGFKAATCDEAQIRDWWTRWPEANIAIATGAMSGVLVVDVDDAEGALLLIDLTKQFGALPMTLQAKTGKGVHLYFALPDGCGRVPSSKGDGLDIRADGGYVLAPGSIHPSGARYEWVDGIDARAEAPAWLIEFAQDRKAFLKAAGLASKSGALSPRPNGERRPAGSSAPANGHGASLAQKLANVHTPTPWWEGEEARLRSALAVIPADNRDIWLKVGGALHDLVKDDPRWAGPGRALWDDWSKTSEKFNEKDQAKTWASFARDYGGAHVTVATIYHLAQENGWRDDAPRFIGAADTPSAKTSTPPRDAELETTFARLASLSRVEYDRAREAEAERLGIRRSTLDEEVEKYRIEDDEKPCSGRALFLPMPEPWPTPIDGSELLDALVGAVATYVRLSEAAAIAVALWCIHAHAFEVATISPRLAITSPEKRCGKTTLLRVIHGLVP